MRRLKNPQHRRQFINLSSWRRLPVLFVECRASEETTLERLKKRQQRPGEVSDATVAIYLRQREEFVPLTEMPESIQMIVNTEGDPEETAGQVMNFLRHVLSSI
jgi:predicted kinase